MSDIFNRRVFYAIVSYSVVALLLIALKPSVLYDDKKQEFKKFGVGEGETLFSLGSVLLVLAAAAYVVVHLLENFDMYLSFVAFSSPSSSSASPAAAPFSSSAPPVTSSSVLSEVAPATVPLAPTIPSLTPPVQGVAPSLSPTLAEVGGPPQIPQVSGGSRGGDFVNTWDSISPYTYYHRPSQTSFGGPIPFPASRLWRSIDH